MQSASPLGRFISPAKSLEGEQSTVLAFYAGAQNAHVKLRRIDNRLGASLHNRFRVVLNLSLRTFQISITKYFEHDRVIVTPPNRKV